MPKLRILVTGDRTTSNTGFSVYKKNLIAGLIASGKYDVAEYGFVGYEHHKKQVAWKFYPTSVMPDDPSYQEYSSSIENKWGAWRWEKVLLHFRPHLVISPIDPWQTRYQAFSALKPYYHLCVSPPIDSGPIYCGYAEILKKADSLVAYINYGKEEMEKAGLTVQKVIPMGIDHSVFYPFTDEQKLANRKKYNIPEGKKVFGFVARNQPRKKLPELIRAFALYIKKYNDQNALLYLHTTYPDDSGWDIPRYLIQEGVYDKVYFTYMCKKTKRCFAKLFSDKTTYSPFVNENCAEIISVNNDSPTVDQLNEIYNLFDVYIQAANCEGFGSPMLEAATVNCPMIVTDYSAMSDMATIFGAEKIKPAAMIEDDRSVLTLRAVIDIEAMADAMSKPLTANTRQISLDNFSWEKNCINEWIQYIDNLDLKDLWNKKAKSINNVQYDDSLSISDNITSFCSEIPEAFSLLPLNELERQYHGSFYKDSMIIKSPPISVIEQQANALAKSHRTLEAIRTGKQELRIEKWME